MQSSSQTEVQLQEAQAPTALYPLKDEKKVTFAQDVVDNQHLQKKKSKACCIYHKRHKDASSSSEYSSSDGEGPNAYEKMPRFKKKKSP